MSIADRAGTQQITFLDTRDLARPGDFYERVPGLRLARDQRTCRIYHVSGGAHLGFCQRADAPAEPRGITLTFVTDRVDDVWAQLEREGIELYNAFVRDPNGDLVEIQRFGEPLV